MSNQQFEDLATGGNVQTRLNSKRIDAATTQLILSEIVSSVEILHLAKIRHCDLFLSNILIDSAGHLLLADFGLSKKLSCIEESEKDWRYLSNICDELFPETNGDESQMTLINLLKNMTDARISGKLFFLNDNYS